MTNHAETGGLLAEDYQAIEDAVMETARGRWFLAEYARRHRVAETEAIVATLERLEKTIKRDRQVPDIDRIRLDLADMAEAISRTKQEIAQMKLETDEGGRFTVASNELDAIVSQTEQATNDILLNAEQIQELAWTLREAGVEGPHCDKLDGHATDIYTACSFQDLTGQRTRKVVTVLRYLESRINSMMGIWGLEGIGDVEVVVTPTGFEDTRPDAHLLNGPQLAGQGIDQAEVDGLMDRPAEMDVDVAPPASLREAEPEVEDVVDAEAKAFTSADFVITPRDAVVLEDDLPMVGAEAGAEEPTGPVESRHLDGQDAVDDLFDSIEADADVFASEPEGDVFALAPEGDVFAAEPEADVFTAVAEELAAAPVFAADAPADVFAPARPAAPVEPAPVEPAPAPRTARPAVVGNTALAAAPSTAAVPVAQPEPELIVVPQDDPIAALSPADRLVAFG